MSNIIQTMISFILLFPIVIFLFVYFLTMKFTQQKARAFGYAADATTVLLFFTVPIAIQALFHFNTMGSIVCIALIMSVIITIMEWKSKTEIELIPLLRKIWRFLFLVLSISYFFVWCVGLVMKILEYIN